MIHFLRYNAGMDKLILKHLPYTQYLQNPLIRWFITLAYTSLLLLLLVQSSGDPVVGPAAPPGDPSPPREVLLTLGHIIGFSILTALWWWSCAKSMTFNRALIIAVVVALIIGLLTELAQSNVPDRNTSVFDMVVNALSTLITAWLITKTTNKP